MEILKLDGPMQDRLKLDDGELEVVRRALKTKLFKSSGGTLEERLPKFQTMITELADKFNIPEPKIILVPEMVQADGGNGMVGYHYDAGSNTIQVGRLSLVSILNGFANAIQAKQEGETGGDFIVAFGLSIFKQAAPAMFEKAMNEGRLYHTDVPYTDGGRIQPVEYNDDGDVEGQQDTPNEHGDVDRGNGPAED